MSRIRFSMANAMLAVALFGVTFGGLRRGGDIWARILFTATYFALIMSGFAALYASGARRAFWLGFVVAGCCGWALAFVLPGLSNGIGNGAVASPVASTILQKLSTTTTVGTRTLRVGPDAPQVYTVINCWITIIFAVAGAFIARSLAIRNASAAGSPGKVLVEPPSRNTNDSPE